jgi:hypothetical protein
MSGCDSPFVPLQENKHNYFSIYGYLDASADTQWVRIMPVRDSLFYQPRPIDATATLTDLSSNNTVMMNDSLFSYFPDSSFYAYNFWTTMDLLPGKTYRLTAKDSNGKTSSAEVTLPPDFPTPRVRMGTEIGDPDRVYIDGAVQLADVQTVYHGRESRTGDVKLLGLPHRQDTLRNPANNNYVISIDPREDRNRLIYLSPVIKSQTYVAAGGPAWPGFGTIDQNVLAPPDGVPNIENGAGYLAGIVGKTIPYESCFEENGITLKPCPLEPPPW